MAGGGAASAQPVLAGLKVGTPLTDALHVSSFPTFAAVAANTHDLAIGPYVELRLPWRLSIEVDAIHRGFDYTPAPGAAKTSFGSWEFPVMAKHRLWGGPVMPYLEGGPVFSHVSASSGFSGLVHDSNYGITVGVGVEIHALVLRLSPEIRYDGFAFRNIDTSGGLLQSNRNQVMFLVGIGF